MTHWKRREEKRAAWEAEQQEAARLRAIREQRTTYEKIQDATEGNEDLREILHMLAERTGI